MGRKIIIGVDLDRTLIYSRRFLEMHPITSGSKAILVEKTDKTESYISSDVVIALKKIKNRLKDKLEIVPVTSRSIEEYKRIQIPEIDFSYAITSAGGVILHNNERNTDWENQIDNLIDLDGMECLMEQLNGMESTDYKSKVIDGVYVFSKCNNIHTAKEELISIRERNKGFDIQMDKHKIYATNKGVNKGTALVWLSDRLGTNCIMAFGDSMMDMPMLQAADKSFTPTHNTIGEQIVEANHINVVSGGTDSIISVLKFIEGAV